MENKLLTTKQLAKHFQVAEITIFRWREQGMPFKRVGATARSIRFEMQEVEKWMEQRQQQMAANN